MPLIDIIKDAAIQVGLIPPTVAASSKAQQDIELVHYANLAVRELRRWHDWSALATDGTITGDGVTTFWTFPADFDRPASGQSFQRSGNTCYKLYGPINADQRTNWRASNVVSLNEVFWLRGGRIAIEPALSFGRVVLYEYQSKNAVRPVSGADQVNFTRDDDTCLINEDIIALGVVWMWKRAKGLDYTQEHENWRSAAQLIAGRDGPLGPVASGNAHEHDLPFPVIPETIGGM